MATIVIGFMVCSNLHDPLREWFAAYEAMGLAFVRDGDVGASLHRMQLGAQCVAELIETDPQFWHEWAACEALQRLNTFRRGLLDAHGAPITQQQSEELNQVLRGARSLISSAIAHQRRSPLGLLRAERSPWGRVDDYD